VALLGAWRGLSIGGHDPLDRNHLQRLRSLLARHPAAQFSEHLAWSSHDGVHYPDLLPLRYDDASLRRVCSHVGEVQDLLGRRMLLENPSTYLEFEGSDHAEAGFLAEVVRRSDAALAGHQQRLCQLPHHRRDPRVPAALPLHAVGEIHLAGHATVADHDGGHLLVDDHGAPVADAVWSLYREVLAQVGLVPTLVEWDTDVPDYPVLRAQAALADACLRDASQAVAA
jgi:hypothetical protein